MALNYLLTMADPFEGMMRLSAVLNTHVGFHLDPFTCFCTCISEVLQSSEKKICSNVTSTFNNSKMALIIDYFRGKNHVTYKARTGGLQSL